MIEITNIMIKDYEYTIRFIKHKDEKKYKDNFDNIDDCSIRLGLCVYGEQVIYIVTDVQKEERIIETIRHELTHAYLEAYKLSNRKYDEEFLCDFIAAYSRDINKLAGIIYSKYLNNKEMKQ